MYGVRAVAGMRPSLRWLPLSVRRKGGHAALQVRRQREERPPQRVPWNNQPLPTLKHRFRDMGCVEGGTAEWAWRDRTTDTGDLKETFSRVRADSPFPMEVKQRAHFLCAQYLGGAWKTAHHDQFTIKQITGGMSNLLFLVELSPDCRLEKSEYRQALLRVHCQTDIDQLLSESVVFTLLSERKLGPRLLGVFPGGRFEEFIPSRPLQCSEISENDLIRKIGPIMARVHILDVPIGKEPQVINRARAWLDKWSQHENSAQGVNIYCTQAGVNPEKHPAHVSLADLRGELEFVERFLECIHSPVVFSHNDMQEGNILLIDESVLDEGEDDLALIDFEYCNYNYRGFDLGNHMAEYGIDYSCDVFPFYFVYRDKFNVEEKRRLLCEGYLNEVYRQRSLGVRLPSSVITGDRATDLQRLEDEAALFINISHIFWVCWALLNAEESSIPFGFAEYARDRLALYYELKPSMEKYMESH